MTWCLELRLVNNPNKNKKGNLFWTATAEEGREAVTEDGKIGEALPGHQSVEVSSPFT